MPSLLTLPDSKLTSLLTAFVLSLLTIIFYPHWGGFDLIMTASEDLNIKLLEGFYSSSSLPLGPNVNLDNSSFLTGLCINSLLY